MPIEDVPMRLRKVTTHGYTQSNILPQQQISRMLITLRTQVDAMAPKCPGFSGGTGFRSKRIYDRTPVTLSLPKISIFKIRRKSSSIDLALADSREE